jgi:arabinofuranosyltransferase
MLPLERERGPVIGRSRNFAGLAALVGALVLLGAGLIWTAWLADDAFITFRSMDNFVHGRGLGWNVGERVQAFTNPLWLFLLSVPYALTGELYWVAMLAGLIGTGVVAGMLVRTASGAAVAALGVLLLAGSKAFLEYGTSGLENPLLHIVVLLAVGAYLTPTDPERRAARVAWATSFAFLTRPDALVLTGVLCVAAWAESPTLRTLRRMIVGWSPAFAWEALSLVYFGSLVPNTAIAKLSGDLPRSEVLQQGLYYLENSMRWDPLTLTTVAVAALVCVPRPGRWRSRELLVVSAVLLHLVYLVRIGGDFMSGRFLTTPFVVAVALIVRARPGRAMLVTSAVVAVVLGVCSERSPWRSRPGPLEFLEATEPTGITDERAVYYAFTGLVSPGHPAWGKLVDGAPYPPAELARKKLAEGERVQVKSQIGMLGCLLGPEVHFVDVMGLADPLLARIPLTTPEGDSLYGLERNELGRFWRIGHLARNVPAGYIESLRTDENRMEHPALARYYGAIRSLTREPLWSRQRWRVLAAFHAGRYDDDLEAWRRDEAAKVARVPAGG